MSQIDLSMGYHNMRIRDSDCQFTAFVLPWGQYEYTRVPFGIKTAPRVFQRVMANILHDLPYVKVFLDDILVHSATREEHINHLRQILVILRDHNVSVNFEKSSFGVSEVSYLGCIINNEGVRPDVTRIDNITLKLPPRNKRMCKSIIGFIEWFRPYIRNLNERIIPLNKKICKETKFYWDENDTKLVNDIIKDIKTQVLLYRPDMNKPFIIEADASDYAIGRILKQENKEIGYFSKHLSKSECNYTVMEKEMLAILRTVQKFRKIIYGSKIIIKTDHANLTFQRNDLSNRVNKWRILLSEYDYTLVYNKGTDNIVADGLSRLFLIQETFVEILLLTVISSEQSNEGLKNQNGFKQIKLKLDIMIYVTEDDKIFIPKSLEIEFINKVHSLLGHLGPGSCVKTVNRFYYFKGMDKKFIETLQNCDFCQKFKHKSPKYGKVSIIKTPEMPFQIVSSDIYGPIEIARFPTSKVKGGKVYILTFTDLHSRFSIAFLIRNIDSETVKYYIDKWIQMYGKPERIITDCGTQYKSKVVSEYLTSNNVKHSLTTPYNPEANGTSERINQVLKRMLSCNIGISILKVIQ
ncbi:TF26 [Hepatospora eriocheir]|uniref:TF26 n=1 Tax=Hepatospora eriocheir TaxID=1081669 RepID=A0A1X0Q9F1_9MICR|nr:TF26 [Hepatospora eriocheir]